MFIYRMAKTKARCAKGTKKLKSPVRRPGGSIRRCTLPKKSAAGRKADRNKSKKSGKNKGSGEFHEVRHRRIKSGVGK